jgi:hypothetical protein
MSQIFVQTRFNNNNNNNNNNNKYDKQSNQLSYTPTKRLAQGVNLTIQTHVRPFVTLFCGPNFPLDEQKSTLKAEFRT